jgi:hypothetical protein
LYKSEATVKLNGVSIRSPEKHRASDLGKLDPRLDQRWRRMRWASLGWRPGVSEKDSLIDRQYE